MDEGTDSERPGAEGDDLPDAGDESGVSESESDPVTVGDGREKHVSVLTEAGERHDHGNVYLKHSTTAFIVSPEQSFSDDETVHYEKTDLRRVEITQHHSACFITTATTDEGPTLDALRDFRDDSLRRTAGGRALVASYEAVSPPIATTLARHPDARTTRLVGWLVERCGTLARRRERATLPTRMAMGALLVFVYVVGVGCAALGHGVIRLRER